MLTAGPDLPRDRDDSLVRCLVVACGGWDDVISALCVFDDMAFASMLVSTKLLNKLSRYSLNEESDPFASFVCLMTFGTDLKGTLTGPSNANLVTSMSKEWSTEAGLRTLWSAPLIAKRP